MAELRVFVSSTCYDLSLLRSQLRHFIKNMGYEPIMSDYEDVLYDPRNHTHVSCIDEVSNCDMLLLIIGSRYGGKAKPEALSKVNFSSLQSECTKVDTLKLEEDCSVTQLEVLKAIESGMPIYTFIDKKVWHDHALYEKNKNSPIIDQIIFPSIEKQETAKYIFNFINFVRLRNTNNNIFMFEKAQDIEEVLKKQWSSYFQRLLREQRFAEGERKRIDLLSERFEELKTAILSSLNDGDQKEIARGVVKYRRLFDFVLSISARDLHYVKTTNDGWNAMLEHFGIIETIFLSPQDETFDGYSRIGRMRIFLLKLDGTFYEVRIPMGAIKRFENEWQEYISLKEKTREVIAEALSELSDGHIGMRHINKPFGELYPQYRASLTSAEEEVEEIMES